MPVSPGGLRRAIARVRPPRVRRTASGRPRIRVRFAGAAAQPLRRRFVGRLGQGSIVPSVVVLILAVATLVSGLPGLPARGAERVTAIGGPSSLPGPLSPVSVPGAAPGAAPSTIDLDADTLAAAPDAEAVAPQPTTPGELPPAPELTRIDPDAVAAADAAASAPDTGLAPVLADGTLVKPVAVDTTVADGAHLIRIHRIVDGDSLPRLAERYGVSMMTIWWANDLRSHNLLIGKTLAIPPVDGLVVTVAEGDTIASLARQHDVEPEAIRTVNELDDPWLVAGQQLILPGAAGDPIPEPRRERTPAPAAAAPASDAPARDTSVGGTSQVDAPAESQGGGFGGAMAWPVVGGNQFVSRGFANGHEGLDVAADHGARVVAAASGSVIFAGWRSNGGGYQVWIAHGGNVFTTYNHLSAITVGNGQGVGPGQLVGRVGASGNSTGPHLHFEVWQGAIWAGGTRVNPMRYL